MNNLQNNGHSLRKYQYLKQLTVSPSRGYIRLTQACANERFILQRDGSDLFTVQDKVCTVHAKKFSLQNYGSKRNVFLDTRIKNN